MEGIVKVKNASYSYYEELILKRDRFKKEAFQYQRAYVREFGELILKVFEKKIDCIKKKKTISFLQTAKNHGVTVNYDELQAFIAAEMTEYENQLEKMVEERKNSEEIGELSESQMLKIRKIYRRLVKLLHPDINPRTEKSEQLSDLWNRIVVSYNCNDLKGISELEVIAVSALERLGEGVQEVEIPDLEEKIKETEREIEMIIHTDPYTLKFILEDKDETAEKKASLQEELDSYEEYEKTLDDIISTLVKETGNKWYPN